MEDWRASLTYEPPPWAAEPNDEFRIEVLREGQLLESLPLKGRSFFVIGSRKDTSHILYENPCVSRKHAVIQFRNDGRFFLFDLKSSFGTRKNKQPIPSGEYVEIHVGDHLHFGDPEHSKRVFLVCGPEHLMPDEDEIATNRKGTGNNALQKEEPDRQDVVGKIPKSKCKRVLAEGSLFKAEAKRKAVFDGERDKGEASGDTASGGVAEGGEEKEEELEWDGDEGEDEAEALKERLLGEQEFYDTQLLFDENDDFFDRTALCTDRSSKTEAISSKTEASSSSTSSSKSAACRNNQRKTKANGKTVATEASLKSEVEHLSKQKARLEKMIESITRDEAKLNSITRTPNDQNETAPGERVEDDVLDAFMHENDSKLLAEKRRKLEERLKDVDTALRQSQRYLKIVQR